MSESTPQTLLQSMQEEARAKCKFSMPREGIFRGVLKASFAKCFEFAQFVHAMKIEDADEGGLYLSGALRGLAEDLIALKFIRKLSRRDRDSVIRIEMMLTTAHLIEKQARFFRQYRPFQPVLRESFEATELEKARNELTAIGQSSKLWNTSKKLPPVEQMAAAVSLKLFYEFIYRMTSRIVHFNVGVALRSGWGTSPKAVVFSSRNFCRYYLELSQFYSVFIFAKLCRAFGNDLRLSKTFMKSVALLNSAINDRLRWPEAVTFEEMNQPNPNALLRAVLRVAHLEKRNSGGRRPAALKKNTKRDQTRELYAPMSTRTTRPEK